MSSQLQNRDCIDPHWPGLKAESIAQNAMDMKGRILSLQHLAFSSRFVENDSFSLVYVFCSFVKYQLAAVMRTDAWTFVLFHWSMW